MLASRQYPQGGRSHHAGFKAVSTGRQVPSCWLQGGIHRAAGAVMLASRQYPQGGMVVAVILASRRYPQGGGTPHATHRHIIAGLS